MTTYVFIVTKDTFPIHLKYMFAGTGAGEDGHENIGMIEDISGCRKGDKVIFYLTQHENKDGKFFGVFEIKSEKPFWQEGGDYPDEIKDKKKLTNRVLISSSEVYAKGVTEWDSLDNLENLPQGKNSPANEMIWSLIYRKLEGKRGCTPIFDYEFKQILKLLKKENNDIKLKNVKNYKLNDDQIEELNNEINYDIEKITEIEIPLIDTINHLKLSPEEKIIKVKSGEFKYMGKYKGREITKTQSKCEEELEYFFIKNIGFDKRINEIMGKDLIFWGSQIFCGVGKRRIDVLTISKENELKIIELKDEIFLVTQFDQLKKYMIWTTQYVREPKIKKITPILVLYDSKEHIKTYQEDLKKFNEEIKIIYNQVSNLKIFIWGIKEDKIYFEEVKY